MALAPASHASTELSDSTLLGLALDGDVSAFDVLYRRHAEVAHRIAVLTAGNPEDGADAAADAFARVFRRIRDRTLRPDVDFRPYLLAAVRNAALDQHRRAERKRRADDPAEVIDLRDPAPVATPAELLVGAVDADLVARAFADLPERWQSVLWLTEVEGLDPRHAADHLGLTPNNTAQLASRARQRLRERYLQAHLAGDVPEDCRFTTERLGAYVGGAVSARDLAKIDQHLASCDGCKERLYEVADVGSSLRRIALPLPLVLTSSAGILSAAGLVATGTAGTVAGGAWGAARGVGSWLSSPPRWAQSGLGVAAAGLLVAGATAIVTHDSDERPPVVLSEPTGSADAVDPDGITSAVHGPIEGTDDLPQVVLPPRVPEREDIIIIDRDGDGRDDLEGQRPPPIQPGPIDEPDPPLEPLVEVGAGGSVLDETDGAVVGVGGATGAHAGPVEVGDEPPTPEDGTARIRSDGSLAPAFDLSL